MKKGIIYSVFMVILLLGIFPSVNQNEIHLYNEQVDKVPELLKTPNEEMVAIEEETGYLEQPTLTPSSGQKITDYINGTRIEIFNNDDFGPSNYDFPGLGIQSDPYLIDSYTISVTTGEALIIIKDTSVFFRISNCVLDGQNTVVGISLINTSHGSIENNMIRECATGVSLHESNLNNISKNKIINSTMYGIALTATSPYVCDDNIISQNTVFNSSLAINLGYGYSGIVSNNSITWNNFLLTRGTYFDFSADTGINNSFQNNHWDTWTGTDTNSDGFVDSPYVTNPVDPSLYFDGINDYGNLANFALNDNFTIEFWVNVLGNTARQTLIGKHDSTGGSNIFLLMITNGYLTLVDRNPVYATLGTITSGWHHFAVVIEQYTTSYNYSIYRNGASYASGTRSPNIIGYAPTDRPWVLGQDWDFSTPTDLFNGHLNEIRFLNSSLTPFEIFDDYKSSINGHYPVQSETVAWYHLDEFAGTSIPDSSGNGYDGSTVNGPSWISYPPGLYFDGVNDQSYGDYVELADFTLNTSFTIELWVNPLETEGCIIGKHPSDGGVNKFLLFVTGTEVRIYNNKDIFTMAPFMTGWQHIAVVVVYEETNVRYQFFRNGKLIKTTLTINTPESLLTSSDKPWVIGQDWDGGSKTDHFKGSISGLRFLNRSLTTEEIYDDYTYPNTYYPNRSETVAWYHLTEQTNDGGNIVADYSGNEFNGSVHGYWYASEAWKRGYLNFDPSPRIAPIWINDNNDFTSFSSSGDGTVDTPYILEDNYLISFMTPAIQIYNTTSHFVIQNSYLDGMEWTDAIVLTNVSNGVISNNYITNVVDKGVELSNTHHITLSSNKLSKAVGEGARLLYTYSSHNNTYTNNTFRNANDGLEFYSCNNNTVSFNQIFEVYSNAIRLGDCFNNFFYGNKLFDLGWNGIVLLGSDYNNFTWNKFSDNWNYAFWISASGASADNNIIQWNYFINNLAAGSGGTSQVYDPGTNNLFSYNYWNDHTEPDGPPADGIVDTPYDIDGGSNQDLTPRSTVGPIVTVVSPFGQTYNTLKINISITGNAIQYWYYIEGTDTQNQTWIQNTNRTISDGTYTLHVYGTDLAGYITQDEVSFTIEFFDIISPLDQEYGPTPINVSFSGYAVHYWYYIDGVDLENQTWTSNTDRTLIEGSYTLHAYGNDSEGNIVHQFVNFTVETTPPVINLISPQSITYFQNTIDLIFTITDYDSYTIYLDGTVIPVPSGTTIQFPGVKDEGSHNITIIAVDHLGNIAQTTIIFSIYIPPTLNIDSPLQTSYATGSVTITLSGDALHYWYYIADIDSTNQTWTAEISRILPAGIYTLHAYGNASSGAIAHQNVTFTIDIPSTTTSLTTTTTQQTSTTTSKSGSFPGFISVFLSIIPMVIFVHRRKK